MTQPQPETRVFPEEPGYLHHNRCHAIPCTHCGAAEGEDCRECWPGSDRRPKETHHHCRCVQAWKLWRFRGPAGRALWQRIDLARYLEDTLP